MSEPKRILVLTADAGFGHRSAANAIAAALEEKCQENCVVEIVNPMEDKRAAFFLRDVGTDYEKIIRNVPELYRFEFEATNNAVPAVLMESGLIVLLFEIMDDLVKSFRPDAIVSTYPLFQAPLSAVFAIRRFYIPLVVVVTDLTMVHRVWFNKLVDACLVATEQMADLAVASGMRADKIRVTGIPVDPRFACERRTQETIRRDLGWRPDLPTILAVGSRRVDHLLETLNVVNHFGMPFQLAVVAGKDDELYRSLVNINWHLPSVHLYEYSSDIPEMMHASDAIICKAGGLIVTESLAAGRPLVLVDVIPGQEVGNAEYVVKNGAGELVESPLDMLEVLAHWTADDWKLYKERAANAARLGKPSAAYEVADIMRQAALHGPVSRKGRYIAGRPSLVNLLSQNHVNWQDRSVSTKRSK
jgi:1,2-diacylglycerol 3-beta-galactosyltransferase